MTLDGYPGSWCEIHGDRIARNLSLAQGLVPAGRKFCAVLKADAYGHGIEEVVPLLREKGVTCVGITSNSEARVVRDAGFDGTLIRLRASTPEEIDDALPAVVEEQVSSLEVAEKLSALKSGGRLVRAHLAVNALGMSRDGIELSTDQGRATCTSILNILGSDIVAISTHFSSNVPEDLRKSSKLFEKQVAWIVDNSALDRSEILVHAGSSLTLVSGAQVETDMYRCGAILYGILKPDLGFRPTMDLKARVVSVGDYPKGATVGYDRDFRLESDRRLACLAIGYASGLRRGLGEGATVTIGTRFAPLVGKVSMNTSVVDVTEISGVSVGDEATVFGGPLDPWASTSKAELQFRTIMADLYTDWGMRNPRIFR